jgi:hypothetical protein
MNENQTKPSRIFVSEASEILGVERSFILHCLRAHWVTPEASEEPLFDEEDFARLQFIVELKEIFGANDEAIPIILHLADQAYTYRRLALRSA